jgi:hypothetical protein
MADDTNAGGASIADLSLYDQVLHGIGRVAQAQVQVEIILRHLYTALTMPSVAAAHLGPRRGGVDQLVKDCRVMLGSSDLPDDYRRAGNDALTAATEADQLRHTVVHQWWVQKMDADGTGTASYERLKASKTTIGYTAEPGDLSYIDEVEERLRRAYIRINSLVYAVTNSMTFAGQPPLVAIFKPDLLDEIRGEFTLLPGGGHRVHGSPSEG